MSGGRRTHAVLAADTSAQIEAMQVDRWRQLTVMDRYDQLAMMVRTARFMARAGAMLRRPEAAASQVEATVARAWIGPGLWPEIGFETIREVDAVDDPDPFSLRAASAPLSSVSGRRM